MKMLHQRNKHQGHYPLDQYLVHEPDLEQFLFTKQNQQQTIDFTQPRAIFLLNRAILKRDYGITYWDFPAEHLCPPIPSRVDYIHHLADLPHNSESVKVFDIGTGATCIYPLLGTAEYDWEFVGSDICQKSLNIAQHIIHQNQLEQKIKLRHQPNSEQVLNGILQENEQFTFTMCNPPFYKSQKDAQEANQRKTKQLKTTAGRNFSGTHQELWCKGGEHHFINTYLYESSQKPNSAEWFTSLIAKKDTLKTLLQSAKKLNVSKTKVIPIQTGHKTARIFAWQF